MFGNVHIYYEQYYRSSVRLNLDCYMYAVVEVSGLHRLFRNK